MDLQEFQQFVRRVGTPALNLSHKDELDTLRLAHVVSSEMRRDFEEFITSSDVVLVVYQADGWGATVRSVETSKIGMHRITRRGQFRHEFGLQRVVAKAFTATDQPRIVMLFSEPVALVHGRSAMHFYTMANEFMSTPQQLGHEGISLTVYVFDGGLQKPLAGFLMARHAGCHGLDPLSSCELVFQARCASHVASCAVNHGLDPCREHADCNKIAHIAIASVRQGVWAVHRFVPDFVQRHVKFEDRPSGSPEEIMIWWRMLGVEDAMIEDVFLKVDPRWDGNNLLVSGALGHSEDSFGLIVSCLQYLLEFQNFIDTRWCGIGIAMRKYLRSRYIGLTAILEICKKEQVNQYHLGGHEQLVPSVLVFMAVAAVGAYVGESYQEELFQDDRILKRRRELEDTIKEEIDYIASLPDSLWDRLSCCIDGACDGTELKHKALNCAMITSAYINRETFAALDEEPLCLAVGNVEANLEALAARQDPARDVVTRQVQDLLKEGSISIARMARAFRLLRETPLTTNLVEQAHGQGACLMKYHETYGERMLRARALVCQIKPLFTASADERRELKLRSKLEASEVQLARAPKRASGFSGFFQQLSRSTDRTAYCERGTGGRGSLVHAATLYNQLSVHEQLRCGRLADEFARSREAELRETCDDLREELFLCEERRARDTEANGLTNHVKSYHFCQDRQQYFLDRMADLKTEGISVLYLEQREVLAPRAPLPEQQLRIIEDAQQFSTQLPCLPWFGPHICWNRDRFRAVALVAGSPQAEDGYLFLYAHQRPLEAEFLHIRRRPLVLRIHDAAWQFAPPALHTYDYLPLEHVALDKLPFRDDDELFVIAGC